MRRAIDQLQWDNAYSRLGSAFYQHVRPTPLPAPYLVAFNPDAAALLDLADATAADPRFVAAMNGETHIDGTDPLATIYAGHQFGVWVPQLGDGRAILLGEAINRRHERWDVQIKGAGPTAFSRRGDGRAVLRSTIREYLGSEAMHGLGIPTTRALAIIGSNAPVYRERTETAALLVRLAPTHVRFGSFELFASRGEHAQVARLADHVIDLYFPELLTLPAAERYGAWYRNVVTRTARLVAQWTATGFTHGVLNTDNMSILGITLDYGPFGWLDAYDRGFIPNHSDPDGRYAFNQQPMVGLWNCARLAEALIPLITREAALAALEEYRQTYEVAVDTLLHAKLGLGTREPADGALISSLFDLLQTTATDYTRFFRALSRYAPGDASRREAVRSEVTDTAALDAWLARYVPRLLREDLDRDARERQMLGANPAFVLRTWLAEDAIREAQAGNFGRIEEIRQVLRAPFDEHPDFAHFADAPPEWARALELSCSS